MKSYKDHNKQVEQVVNNDPDRCYFGKCPTLAFVNACYPLKDVPAAQALMYPYFIRACEYMAGSDKPTPEAVRMCCANICAKYYYLKVTEVLLFLNRCCAGQYGERYGDSVPAYINRVIRGFMNERARAIEAREQAEREREREERAARCVTREEYEQLKQ